MERRRENSEQNRVTFIQVNLTNTIFKKNIRISTDDVVDVATALVAWILKEYILFSIKLILCSIKPSSVGSVQMVILSLFVENTRA